MKKGLHANKRGKVGVGHNLLSTSLEDSLDNNVETPESGLSPTKKNQQGSLMARRTNSQNQAAASKKRE